MGRNHPAGLGFVDCSRLEEVIRVSYQRSGHGEAGGKVHRREVRQPTSPKGQILPTGMHGSENKTGPGVFGPHSLSRVASKGDSHCWEHHIWRLHRRMGGGLGASDPGCGPEAPDQSR